jgi:hypothetical protein
MTDLRLATEPDDDDRLADLIPDYWQRRFMAEQLTVTFLRTCITGAITDLESDRPRDHIAGALAAALESF